MSESERAEAPPAAPKEDPGRLVLRGRPRPAIRFRRGLVIGVAGTATAALAGLAWVALEPPSLRLAGGGEEAELASRAAPDGLADAPASYADVPQLGPPLPGDLGGPILEQQRRLGDAAPGGPDAIAAEEIRDRQRQAEQRLAEQEEAARTSAVLVRLASAADPAQEQRFAQSPAAQPAERIDASAAPPAVAGQQRKIEFAGSRSGDTNPHTLVSASSPWTLSAGTVIPAGLVTGINSDLPGIVLAQVVQNVRDSATGTTVLIPQGSRLIGSYDSMVAFGQRRALVVWQRIVLPDGSSVRLDNVPAADLAGYSGLADKVDFHEWRLLKGIALSSLLGTASELSLGSEDDDLVRALERSVQRDGARAGDRLVSRNLDVQPTLTVRPGWPVRAVLHKDLVLKPWKG